MKTLLAFLLICSSSYAGVIQDKIDAASDGDIIPIADGVYDELVTVNKAITLTGVSLHGTEILRGVTITAKDAMVQGIYIHDVTNRKSALEIRANNVIVSDILIERANRGLDVRADDVLIDNLEIRDLMNYGRGDVDYSRLFGRRITMTNCYFHGTDVANIGSAHVDAMQSFTANSNYLTDSEISHNVFEDFHQGVFLEDIWDNSGEIARIRVHDNIFRNPLKATADGGNSQGVVFKGAIECVSRNNLFTDIKIGVLSQASGTGASDLDIFERVKTPHSSTGIVVGDNFMTEDAVPLPLPEGHAAVGYGPESIQPLSVVEPEPEPSEPEWGVVPFTLLHDGIEWEIMGRPKQ